MRTKRITICAVGISIVFYSVFVFLHEQYAHDKIQKQIEEHALIIADDVWNFNYQGASQYLMLAAASQSYEKLEVTDYSGKVFASIDMPYVGKFKKLY